MGISNFSFRLPSILFSILGLYSTYKLGTLLKNKQAGILAALILGTCQGYFVMNVDVKTDMYLIGSVCFACWQILAFNKEGRWHQLVLGFIGIGLAMLSKGPLGLIIPAMAIGTHFIVTRDWKAIFRWQWLPGLIIAGVVLVPMSIGLYTQYDLHPEMEVNGETGVSGLRFFYWTQSFGRVTGESEWKNDAGPFFLVTTFLWAFVPWTLSFLVSFVSSVRKMIIGIKFKDTEIEGLSLGGFLLPMLALSLSNFKLPHYIFVVLPFAAIMLGIHLITVFEKEQKQLKRMHIALILPLAVLEVVAVVVLKLWAFPDGIWLPMTMLVLLMVVSLVLVLKDKGMWKMVFFASMIAISANVLLNLGIYPGILGFQSSTTAGKFLKANSIPKEQAMCYLECKRSLDLYAGYDLLRYEKEEDLTSRLESRPMYVFGNDRMLLDFDIKQLRYEILAEYGDHHPGKLSFALLNPRTRAEKVNKTFLIRLDQIGSDKE